MPELWRFRELVWAFGFRDLKVRYRQTAVGIAWAIIQPLMTVIVFGIVGRRVVRRGNFESLSALEERLMQFIEYFNRTFARPFRWTYTGRPVTAKTTKRPPTWKESWATHRTNSQTLALAG